MVMTKIVPSEPTPEMLMNAQGHSETGAHNAANWAGAYDCFIEFYKAMLAAAPEAASEGGMVPREINLWQEGISGNCNVVTFDGSDIVGVCYIPDPYRAIVIKMYNRHLDSLNQSLAAAPVSSRRLPSAQAESPEENQGAEEPLCKDGEAQ
jgi:hypothetical protein